MKNPWGLLLIVGQLFVWGVPLSSQATLRLGTGDWAPLTGERLPGGGPLTEVVVAAFREAGIAVTVEYYLFKRAESLLQQGELDAIFPYGRNAERESQFVFAKQLYYSKARFFYLKGRVTPPVFQAYEDLRPFRIGGLRGSWFEPTFDKAGLKVNYLGTDLQVLQMLAAGRVDLVPMSEVVAWDLLRREFPDLVGKVATMDFYPQGQAPQDTSRRGVNLMLRAADPRAEGLIARFNQGLTRVTQSGNFRDIFARHLPPEVLEGLSLE